MTLIDKQVQNAIHLHEKMDIPALQQQLYELYINFNTTGGGRKIIEYPRKLELCRCFTLMLCFDWMHDDDIREVWAENAFYCVIIYMAKKWHSLIDRIKVGEHLFNLLYFGHGSLKPKIEDILIKSRIMGKSVFSEDDYRKGASYVIEQFFFMSAYLMRPLADKYPVLNGELKDAYDKILQRTEFLQMDSEEVLAKAAFITRVIGSILNDM